ncbi:hypothetical protein RM190_17515 [Paracoccus sp. CPCC 101403]|uniref:Uncharacterized protein n=1 Tax=Paracoccus broussonetiae TaxID=3075834 RepID=A0ABU3EHE5_9RHOB|nr:hypothetical protein [Paracoccus sp. CPCC 101403]MDT1063673.1 hypothetical protein [Paracoccus sp. CPCC 101403]
MRTLHPLYPIIFARQRGTFSGAIPRPYALNPKKEGQIAKFIKDWKSAFDAGVKTGEPLKAKF